MIIIIAGFPGIDTKKMCKTLALRLGLRHLTSEELQKSLAQKGWDATKQKIQTEERKGNFITDSMLASKQVQNALRVFLNSAKRIRAKKLAEAERMPVAAALERIEDEEKSLEKTMSNTFGTAFFNPEEFDIMLNIDRFNEESTIALIEKILEKIQK